MRDRGVHGAGRAFRRVSGLARIASRADAFIIRIFDGLAAIALILLLMPVIVTAAAAIKLESRGPVLYRSRRVGRGGREFDMLKFRKMLEDAGGLPLTAPEDERFTRIGRFLARTKLDELPQLWNVIRGSMSLVGPRPEDPYFVEQYRSELEAVLSVRPGITGFSQLAFARESEILDPANREEHYVDRILPQKIRLDTIYATQRSTRTNARVLYWTVAAVLLRRDVAVNRTNGKMGLRLRPLLKPDTLPVEPIPELTAIPAEQPGA